MVDYKNSKIVATFTEGTTTYRIVRLSKSNLENSFEAAAVETLGYDAVGAERWDLYEFYDFKDHDGPLEPYEAVMYSICKGTFTL